MLHYTAKIWLYNEKNSNGGHILWKPKIKMLLIASFPQTKHTKSQTHLTLQWKPSTTTNNKHLHTNLTFKKCVGSYYWSALNLLPLCSSFLTTSRKTPTISSTCKYKKQLPPIYRNYHGKINKCINHIGNQISGRCAANSSVEQT